MTNDSNDPAELLYIRLLNLMDAIRSLPPFSEMDPTEEQLLNRLLLRWHGGERINVADVMRSETGVSRTTTYRRLLALKAKGMIDFVDDATDKRVKNIVPTKNARCFASRMNDCINQLATG